MRLTIESTDIMTEIDGVPVRLWRGRTESGRPLDVFVHRVGTDDATAQFELSMALRETAPPEAVPAAAGTRELDREDLELMVRHAVEANRSRRRESAAQEAMDRATEAALAEGQVHVASALLLLSAHCVLGLAHRANQVLLQSMVDRRDD